MALLVGVSACTITVKPLSNLCGTDSLIIPINTNPFRASVAQNECAKRKVRVRLEVSNLTYIYRRSIPEMDLYIRNLFKIVQDIYKNEPVPITLEIASIKIWDTPDPYAAYTNGSTVLYNFATTEFAKPEQSNYDLAVFIDRNNGTNNKASYAYTSGLNPGFYGQKYAYVCIPIDQPGTSNYKLAAKTIAHEMGHNFGLKHTQWCGNIRDDGSVGPLDSCWQPEPISGQPSCKIVRKNSYSGTIMSYCDLVYNGGVDFSKGFGFKSLRATMQQTLAACTSCPCEESQPPPPCTYTYSSWSTCQPNGTQTRTVISQTPIGCTGTPALSQSCTYVPPVQTDGVIGPVMHYTQNGTSFFRFQIPKDGNWLYKVEYCRYDGSMNPPDSVTPPAACGVRNALNFSRPSAIQLSNGLINLQAIQQPNISGKWYRVKVQYKNGPTGAILTKQSSWFWW